MIRAQTATVTVGADPRLRRVGLPIDAYGWGHTCGVFASCAVRAHAPVRPKASPNRSW